MQAILKASETFKAINGHTFEVELEKDSVEVKGTDPNYPGLVGIFHHTEVLIVNLDAEHRKLESLVADRELIGEIRYKKALRDKDYLQRYCIANGFEFTI